MGQQVPGLATGNAEAAALAAKSSPAPAAEPDALHDVAALLAEQLSACHAAAARCFAIANDEEDFQMPVRLEALKLATRLVQASAAAAPAVKRVKGGEFHHHVTVNRIDYSAEKAARKAREEKAKSKTGYAKRTELMDRLRRVAEAERSKLTPEERATVDRIWAAANKRPYAPSSEDEPRKESTAA